MYLLAKYVITSAIIVAVSEIAKRSTLLGAALASLPLTSLLAFIWLYVETKDSEKVAELSIDIFWLVIPSLTFFALLPILLRMKYSFLFSIVAALLAMLVAYSLAIFLKRFLAF